jgi:diguanylate cyclase (GGDEF)-like protein
MELDVSMPPEVIDTPEAHASLDANMPPEVIDTPEAHASMADRAIEWLPYPVVVFDRGLRLRLVNAAARERLGPPTDDEDPAPPLEAVLARSSRIASDVRLRIVSCCAAAVRGENTAGTTDAVFALSSGRTIALRTRALGNDRWMAVLEDRSGQNGPGAFADETQRDNLTGLGSRRHMEKKLAEALLEGNLDSNPAILVLDIDRFREINDRLGRQGGDALLCALSGRLRRATRESDEIARLDGDAFAVLQYGGLNAGKLADRLVDLLSRPYLIDGEVAIIGVSVGVARAPEDGEQAAVLLQNADLAQREAKDSGGHTWRRFGHKMAERARTRLDLEADLRKSLALGEFSLAYQPKVNLRTRTVTGFEALARWTHPTRGPVSPAVFIPVAEDIGTIHQIGDWALRTACLEAASWPAPLTVAVNVSGKQLDDGRHLMSTVVAVLQESGLPAERLELEITESALTRHPDAGRTMLQDLHDLGVRISMDDFGTGYSSLGRLRTYPFDTIKIDQSFVRSLNSSSDSVAFVRAIAILGAGLGMAVIAEGVETRTQARMVEVDGCTDIQGFLISRPVPAADIPGLLALDLATILGS